MNWFMKLFSEGNGVLPPPPPENPNVIRADIPKKRFVAAYPCSKCKTMLTHTETYHSEGVCPYCGNTSTGPTCLHGKKVSMLDKYSR